jgi:hypothetical protein
MCGARGGEYFISKPRWSSGKVVPGGPSSGLKGSILYLEIVNFFIFVEQRSCDGRGARSEPKKTEARSARARTRGQNPLYIVRLDLSMCSNPARPLFVPKNFL